jgi:two-component system sensor histidine kinase QseC
VSVPRSIRNTLLWLLLSALVIAWFASAWLVYREAHREIDALLDAQLRQSAQMLSSPAGAASIRAEPSDDEEDEDHQFDRFRTGVAYQVRAVDGTLQLRSANSPVIPFSDSEQGFESVRHGAKEWRVYTMRRADGTIVQLAEDHFARERIARDIALEALTPMLFVLPLLGLGIGWVVQRSLRPLEALGAEIARRGGDDLAPLAAGQVPTELAPLKQRIDELFSRIRTSVDSERRFTSHAAHELRTPVAALRAQAEVAGATSDPEVRAAALGHCIEACDRMTRLVSQMLVLARADELAALANVQACRLDSIAQGVLAELAPSAARDHVELELDVQVACDLHGDPDLLAVMLRNLVDNAVRHARRCVAVALRMEGGAVVCSVTDDGPGIPEESLAQMGQRFFRAPGVQGPGSGLGLSIVAKIVSLHDGTVQFANMDPLGAGFRATVSLPR